MITTEQILALEGKLYRGDEAFYLLEEIHIVSDIDYDVVFDATFIRVDSLTRFSGRWSSSWFEKFYSRYYLE